MTTEVQPELPKCPLHNISGDEVEMWVKVGRSLYARYMVRKCPKCKLPLFTEKQRKDIIAQIKRNKE